MELRTLLVVDVKAGDASTVSLLAAGFKLSGLIPSHARSQHHSLLRMVNHIYSGIVSRKPNVC